MCRPVTAALLALALASLARADELPRAEAVTAATAAPAPSLGVAAASASPVATVGPSEQLPPALRPRASTLVPALELGVITAYVMSWNRWVGEAKWAGVGADSIRRNLGSRWVFDDDQFWVNQFGHPYQGTWSMAAARTSGLSFWASVPYVVAGSGIWEIAGETERPSINDQVTTTFGGALLGEVLHRVVLLIGSDGGGPWRDFGAALLSPVSAANRAVLGERGGVADEPWAWELSAGPILARLPWDLGAAAPAWEAIPGATFVLEHGLPWHPGFRLERPFDAFQLVASYSGRSDPAATLLVSGLLGGERFTSGRWRGVWGAYGSFDLDTPGIFRVSTSALGVGGEAGAPLTHGLGLSARAVLSGIALGATGEIPRTADGTGRDYRFGPGVQSSLQVALSAPERATLRLGLRQYLVFGVHDSPGTELIGAGHASAVFHVAGEHGVGVEATLWRRDVWDRDGHGDALGRAFRIFWAVSGAHEPAGGSLDVTAAALSGGG